MKMKIFFCSLSIMYINLTIFCMEHTLKNDQQIKKFHKESSQKTSNDTVIPNLHLSQLSNAPQEKHIIETFKDFETLRESKKIGLESLQTNRHLSVLLPQSLNAPVIRPFTEENFKKDLKTELMHQCNLLEYDAQLFQLSYGEMLYNFGKNNGLSLDDTVIYGVLLRKFEMTPQALIEFINHQNNIAHKKAESWQINDYSDIKKNKPEQYTLMALDAIKLYFEDEHGKYEKKSALITAHIEALGGKVKGQRKIIYLQEAAMALKVIIIIGQLAWAIYGQVTSLTNKGNHTC